MNINEFKEKLNKLNNKLKTQDINEIVKEIKETFFTLPKKLKNRIN